MRGMLGLVSILAVGLLALAPSAAASDNLVANLSGKHEVSARDTQAVAVATFKLRADGTQLQFKINVANLDNAVAAHIHCAAVGVNCPVGVTLFGGAPGGSGVQGTLVKGTISAPDPANGCDWTNLAMVAAMETRNTYINVHTNDRVPPIDTRPGDFPGGEIRGQVH